jgi:hypothetical protein
MVWDFLQSNRPAGPTVVLDACIMRFHSIHRFWIALLWSWFLHNIYTTNRCQKIKSSFRQSIALEKNMYLFMSLTWTAGIQGSTIDRDQIHCWSVNLIAISTYLDRLVPTWCFLKRASTWQHPAYHTDRERFWNAQDEIQVVPPEENNETAGIFSSRWPYIAQIACVCLPWTCPRPVPF